MKLVRAEPETEALWAHLDGWPERVSSVVAWVEVLRAVRRATDVPEEHLRAESVLHRIGLLELTDDLRRRAVDVVPASLRSLDAIHLATALDLEDDLGEMVVYDTRLAEAAKAAGMVVVAPGSEDA